MPASLPPLRLALVLAVTASLTVDRVVNHVEALWEHPTNSDFGEYFIGARIALAHGWAAIYDLPTYVPADHAFVGRADAFVNLPLVAVVVAPLTAVPFPLALVAWSALLLAATAWAWRTAAPDGDGWARATCLTAWIGAFPLAFALQLGQFCVFVTALVVLHWWLLRSGRPILAGVALGLAFVKPQMVVLLPAALVLSGRWRAAAACAATVAAIAGLCFLLIGPHGIAAYRASGNLELTVQRWPLSSRLPAWLPMLPVRLLVAVVALVPALFAGRRRYELAIAGAVMGTQLITPYLNPEDFAVLFPCAWLVLRVEAGAGVRAGMLVSYLTLVFANLTGPIPVLTMELAWLVALAAVSLRAPRPVRSGSRGGRTPSRRPRPARSAAAVAARPSGGCP